MKSILREPLLHFLVLGAALFAYFRWSGGGPTSGRIVLTPGQLEHLASGFARTWQRPPTEAELKGLVDDWVREEIAVREATEAGLDRDDTVIRRRLRQKLEFIAEDLAVTQTPSDAELQAWLDAHPEGFRLEPETAFRQVFVRDPANARALLPRLRAAGPDAPIDALGDASLLPREVERSARRAVESMFGPEFASSLDSLPSGTWAGPIASAYGHHLVIVRERVEGSLPDLATIRPAVEREWLADRRIRQLDAMYERLLGKYTVVIEAREARP